MTRNKRQRMTTKFHSERFMESSAPHALKVGRREAWGAEHQPKGGRRDVANRPDINLSRAG